MEQRTNGMLQSDIARRMVGAGVAAAARHAGGVELFLSPSQREPLLALLRGLESGESLIVITGEAGVGKTTLLDSVLPAGEGGGTQRVWIRNRNAAELSRARVMLELATQNVTARSAAETGSDEPAQARRTILVVDNAHLLTAEAAGGLVDLLGPDGGQAGALQLVLLGRPSLWSVLRQAGLVDRARISGEVTGLPLSEVREYLRERLETSGTPIDEILSEDARLAFLRRLRWTPAELNLILASVGDIPPGQGAGWITREIVEQAAPGARRVAAAPFEAAAKGEADHPAASATFWASARRLVAGAVAATAVAGMLASGALYWWRLPDHAAPPVPQRVAAVPDHRDGQVATTPPTRAMAQAMSLPPVPVPPPAQRPAAPASVAPEQAPPKAPPATQAPLPEQASANSRRAAPTMPAAQLDDIFRRGEAMLARGDVQAARALYRRAAMANSAAAATVVGKTYDPTFLAGIGATKVKGAVSRAVTWYRRAAELGDREGRERLLQLRSSTDQVAGNE